jgi:hypothetical protein
MAILGRKRTKGNQASDVLFGYLIPLLFIGIAVADFLNDGKIDKYIIGALLIFGLGALGWRVDVILERYFQARAAEVGGGPQGPAPPDPGADQGGENP